MLLHCTLSKRKSSSIVHTNLIFCSQLLLFCHTHLGGNRVTAVVLGRGGFMKGGEERWPLVLQLQ